MTRTPRTRIWRSALAASAAIAVTAGVVAAAPEGRTAAAAAPNPKLSLVTATASVNLTRYPDDPDYPQYNGVLLDLGTYVGAQGSPFELKVTRKSYKDPVVAQQIIHEGKKKRVKNLPKGLVKDFRGLPGFLDVSVSDASGKTVFTGSQDFCPNNASGRISHDAPVKSRYPQSCPANPFTLGSVWGVEKGWAANTFSGHYDQKRALLGAGSYTAKVTVAKKYRDLFGIAGKAKSVKVNVEEYKEEPGGPQGRSANTGAHDHHAAGHASHGEPQPPASLAEAANGTAPTYNVGHGPYPPAPPALPWALKKGARSAANVGDKAGQTDGSRMAAGDKPAAKRPTGKAKVPNVPKPDLRSLPAFGIITTNGTDGGAPGRDELAFSANVWNAGPAKLIVEGFRAPGKELMDAYQYFYDAKGKQVGYTPSGTMEWDPREGHDHWHFTDFASYQLLTADKKKAVRSGKEAFCLANTDAVDYTVKNANWHPTGTNLSQACGEETAISVQQQLDVGSGDTYTQGTPDQSFDITDVPNGTYYIEVLANPEKRLKETSTSNNSALRKVVLGGKKGARTVTVPPHHLVDAN
ncbi:lysyl oxidase family protein [Streptomyces sp. NPDC020141]|uniref:lysyl oxidase family protein n=1 Tax=Streptomyces sp. NPDC020141 TaxID=3365065 RepID=UPI0037A3A705